MEVPQKPVIHLPLFSPNVIFLYVSLLTGFAVAVKFFSLENTELLLVCDCLAATYLLLVGLAGGCHREVPTLALAPTVTRRHLRAAGTVDASKALKQ